MLNAYFFQRRFYNMFHLIWKNEAKRIINDEVIKQFGYLDSKIDWVLND